jgi:phage terminase large subunit-like protein
VLAVVAPDGSLDIVPYFWTPHDRMTQKETTDKVPYPLWVKQGHMEATPGTAIRKDAIVRRIAEIIGRFEVKEIAYDRHRIEDLIPFFDDEGLDRDLLVPFGQGFVGFGPAVDALETAVLNREIRHPGNPCLTWNIANSVVVQDAAGNRKLDKSKSTGRIDGAVAMAMAVRQAMVGREAAPSPYESRGLLVF